MCKNYQPIIKETASDIITDLDDSGFFIEYEISNMELVNETICNKLTEKFIQGDLDSDGPIFSEDEFTNMLKELIAGEVLHSLKNKGYINSYEDDDTEELFFLTEDGKRMINEELKKNRA